MERIVVPGQSREKLVEIPSQQKKVGVMVYT
jgi:hypothetical protein